MTLCASILLVRLLWHFSSNKEDGRMVFHDAAKAEVMLDEK